MVYNTTKDPMRYDPTRTSGLRKRFATEFTKRFERIRSAMIKLIVVDDALGLKPPNLDPFANNSAEPTTNTRWQFLTLPQKVKAFQEWLATQVLVEILGEDDKALWTRYIEEGARQGVVRAYDDVMRRDKVKKRVAGESLDFYAGSRQQFLRDAFTQPVAVEKVQLMSARVFTDLKNVTDAMSTQMSRVLTDGLVQGKSPRVVGSEMAKAVDGIGKQRAVLIARTETIRAHAEGQLTAFEQLGVEELGVAVEWDVTGDGRVCPMCKPLDGIILKVNEARGMIPRHPGCRCAWVPANVGEATTGQKRTKPQIASALASSNKQGGEDAQISTGAPLSATRPESVLNQVSHTCVPGLDILSRFLVENEKGGANCGVGVGGFQHGNVCARGAAAPHPADKVKFIGKVVGAAEHHAADQVSHSVAKGIGGVTEEHAGGPGQKDKKPFDVRAPKEVGKGHNDVEVKSLLKGGKQTISVHDDALLRKVEHAKANPQNTFHTVVVDKRATYQSGIHKDGYSGHELYYKRGSGRYALSKMHKVKNMAELKTLINTPDKKLPEKARGKLPPPPPINKLKEAAAKASESRKTRDKARKERNKDKLKAQAAARAARAKAGAT